jgi:hypothetical protein
MAAASLQPKGMICFSICFDSLGRSCSNYGKQENNFKNDWAFWFYGCFDLYFLRFLKIYYILIPLPITMPIMFLMVYWWEDFTEKVLICL